MSTPLEPVVQSKKARELFAFLMGFCICLGLCWLMFYTNTVPFNHGDADSVECPPCDTPRIVVIEPDKGQEIAESDFNHFSDEFANKYPVTATDRRLGLYGGRIGRGAIQNLLINAKNSGDPYLYFRLGMMGEETVMMFTTGIEATSSRMYYRNNGAESMCPLNCETPSGNIPRPGR